MPKVQKKVLVKKNKQSSSSSKLKTIAIAYEFARCHGYGIKESEVDEMWDETNFEKGSVDTSGIGTYEGMSVYEIANAMVREILK